MHELCQMMCASFHFGAQTELRPAIVSDTSAHGVGRV